MGNMQFLRSASIPESGAKASAKVREEQAGLRTHEITKTITYYYLADPNTPPPPNPNQDGHLSDLLLAPGSPARPAPTPRPLVIFFTWHGARREAVAKYRDLYLERGMDVLAVESSVWHFLWPRWGVAYGAAVLAILERPWLLRRPLLVHASSIGGYTFGNLLIHMAADPHRYGPLSRRISGQVYDSLVIGSLDHMATGLGKTLFPLLGGLVRNAALFFFWLFKRHTVDFYDRGVVVFHHIPVRAPALFFFCDNDAMCDPVAAETLVDFWTKGGIRVARRRWAKSVHAGHLRCHRDEYLASLEAFLSSLTFASLTPG